MKKQVSSPRSDSDENTHPVSIEIIHFSYIMMSVRESGKHKKGAAYEKTFADWN